MSNINTTKFSMIRDINGFNGFGLKFSTQNYSATIATGVEQKLTVPSDSKDYLAVFSIEPGAKVWVSLNSTAAVPVAATFGSTTSVMNPSARYVSGGAPGDGVAADILHFITDDATAEVGVTFYALS